MVITNAASPSPTVNTALNLTVLPDTDGDGLPDAWETAHGLSATDPAFFTGSGQTNQWEITAVAEGWTLTLENISRPGSCPRPCS